MKQDYRGPLVSTLYISMLFEVLELASVTFIISKGNKDFLKHVVGIFLFIILSFKNK